MLSQLENRIATIDRNPVERSFRERASLAKAKICAPLDAVFLFRHSSTEDAEILYSLRSIAAHLPYIRKVWVFGDRPSFLSDDKAVIEHVFHGYLAPLFGYQMPVRSDFLMLFLASLIPDLAFHFVRFADDYVVLESVPPEELLTPRAKEDLNSAPNRGQTSFQRLLWRTHDILKRYGYAGYNFESHTPQPLTKQLVFEAFMAFRQFLSEDRFAGMVAETTIYNFALKHYGLKFNWLAKEKTEVGFYEGCPSLPEIEAACRGKLFLNFNDAAFDSPMREFLKSKFPQPCKYERDYQRPTIVATPPVLAEAKNQASEQRTLATHCRNRITAAAATSYDHAEPRLDIVYIFRHSKANDQEIRYSLRSVAHFLPFIRKVWVFGDRPCFLSPDKTVIEHVSHEYMAPLLGYDVPVRNDFLMHFLASLIPGLTPSFVRFSDDYIVLAPLSREQLCIPRALEDLDHTPSRGKSAFKDQLWRTYDTLKAFGYGGANFEAHVPQPHTKKCVYEAFMAFREFLTEERYGGLVTATTVYNYARKHSGPRMAWLAEENSRAGFYGSCPSQAEIAAACRGKLFLNFDDRGFGEPMRQFLERKFPEPCKYERQDRPSGSCRLKEAP